MALSESKNIGWKRWILLVWAFIEIVLFSGIVFGWGSLVFVLKDEGIYADLCLNRDEKDNNTGSNSSYDDSTASLVQSASTSGTEVNTQEPSDNVCKPQDENMALCFTIATALVCVAAQFIGHISYKFGTRIYRLIGFTTFTCGALMMAFVSNDIPWLIYPGLPLISIGGLTLIVGNTQIANLFDRGRSTIVVCLNSAYIISSGVQLLVKLLHEHGFSRQKTYIVIVCLHSLTLVSTFGFMPKTFIHLSEGPLKKQPSDELTSGGELVDEKSVKSTKQQNDGRDQKTKGQKHGLLKCMKQPFFVTHCIWFCILQLKFFYFTGILNMYLNRNLDANKEKVSQVTDIWIYIMMGGALPVSLLVGSIYDWQKKRYSEHSSIYRALMPAVLPHALGSLLFVLFSILTLIPSKVLIYPVFFLMTAGRAFLYGLALAFLNAVFPSEYMGFLFGFLLTAGGITGLLQYAFFTWAESYPDGPLHGDILLLVLVFISFVHPFCIWLTCKRAEQSSTGAKEIKD